MSDPLDRPPADHGSDRYDYIEVEAPKGIDPPLSLVMRYDEACPDCRANVFFRLVANPVSRRNPDGEPFHWLDLNGHHWHVTVAHDQTCAAGTRLIDE